jgi:hypothetical protein
MVHTGLYTATVSGSAGVATFDHGAGFTPTFGLISFLTNATQGNWSPSFGTNGFTATQAQFVAFEPTGTHLPNGDSFQFYAMFMA